MRIGIDIDNVCYPFTDVFRLWAEHCAGKKFRPIREWDFYKDWGMTTEEFSGVMREGHDEKIVYHIGSPLEGCVETLEFVKGAGHELVLCTTRPQYADFATYDWVDRWQIPHDEIIITEDKTDHGFDILLDDAPHLLKKANQSGIAAVCFDQPWNRGLMYGTYWKRIALWPEFEELI